MVERAGDIQLNRTSGRIVKIIRINSTSRRIREMANCVGIGIVGVTKGCILSTAQTPMRRETASLIRSSAFTVDKVPPTISSKLYSIWTRCWSPAWRCGGIVLRPPQISFTSKMSSSNHGKR